MIHRTELLPGARPGTSLRIAGALLVISIAGCAGKPHSPEADPPWMAPPPAVKSQPVEIPATRPAAPATPKQDAAVVVAPAPPPAAPVEKPEPVAVKPATPAAKPEPVPEKPAARAPVAPAPKQSSAPAPRPATLDLASLEKRLKDTNAIGVFTKLTLKNQVDDLINQFRLHYQGRTKTTLAALRQPYDQLLLKVLSLLQDSDPPLARAIADSREAIWGILSDPEKFKNL